MFCNALDRSWPSGSNQTLRFAPCVKIQTWAKLAKYSTGNFIHVQLQPPCLLPASVWCPTPPWTLWPLWSVIKLLLAANEVLKTCWKSAPCPDDSLPSAPEQSESGVSFLICPWLSSNAHQPHLYRAQTCSLIVLVPSKDRNTMLKVPYYANYCYIKSPSFTFYACSEPELKQTVLESIPLRHHEGHWYLSQVIWYFLAITRLLGLKDYKKIYKIAKHKYCHITLVKEQTSFKLYQDVIIL